MLAEYQRRVVAKPATPGSGINLGPGSDINAMLKAMTAIGSLQPPDSPKSKKPRK